MLLKLSLLTLLILQGCIAPPVTKNKSADGNENGSEGKETGLEDYMEYHRYLKEVVDALESDPQFREKLEKAEEADIRSGKIAHELEFVNHKIRSRLDEIKRSELERLRHLAIKQYEIENGLNQSQGKVGPLQPDKEHLDHANPHTFEIEDLKKLIAKSTQDLAEADRKRREEFKQYEMQKEFEKQEKLKSLDESHRVEAEKQLKEQEEKHRKHEPLHHPGSKQQLEEVWEKQDHMDQQEFDPRTFFMLHDLDGNGVWDENEVKTLFIKELDKMYQEGAPEDDMRERIEEMERMREHVFNEVDRNKDGLISYEEFLEQTKKQEFQEDKGWETLDQQKVYTEEEYRQFEKRRLEEVERLVAQGMLPPHPGGPVYYDPGMAGHGQFPPQHAGQYYPQGQMPPHGQVASSHGQVPPGHGQVPPGHGQVPPGHGQVPPGHGQVPPGYGQVPPGHGQIPPGHGQVPPGHAQVPPGHGQVPQGYGQVPSSHGQVPPGRGQVPPGHGQVPPGHGQVPPGHGQVPPSHGQVPQQQYYQGQGQQPQMHHENQPKVQVQQPDQVSNQGKTSSQNQLPALNTNEVYPNNVKVENQILKQQPQVNQPPQQQQINDAGPEVRQV